jgi:hypothetical protein
MYAFMKSISYLFFFWLRFGAECANRKIFLLLGEGTRSPSSMPSTRPFPPLYSVVISNP